MERSFGVITPLNLAAKRLRSPFVFLFVSFFLFFFAVGSDVGFGRKTDRIVRRRET